MAVVLVSELLPFGNWDEVVLKCINFSKDNKIPVQVLDLQELTTLVRVSKNSEDFDYYLVERWRKFFEKRYFNIRVKPVINKT